MRPHGRLGALLALLAALCAAAALADAGKLEPETCADDAATETPPTAAEEDLLGVVQEELRATEEIIGALQRRAGALERLRDSLVAGGALEGATPQRVERLLEALAAEPAAAKPAAAKPAAAKQEPHSQELHRQEQAPPLGRPTAFFGDFFSLKYSLPEPAEDAREAQLRVVLALPLKSRKAKSALFLKGYPAVLSLVLTVWADGSATLLDAASGLPAGELQLVTGGRQPVRTAGVILAPLPVLVVVHEDGLVVSHELSVSFFGERVAGVRRQVGNLTSPDIGSDTPNLLVFADETFRADICADAEASDEEEDEQIEDISSARKAEQPEQGSCRSLGIARAVSFRRSMALVSYADGELRIHKNGRTLWSRVASEEPVRAVASNANQLAYSTGRQVFLAAPSGLGTNGVRRCDGEPGTVLTSLAFDELLPMRLYAGTDQGEAVVFNTRSRGKSGATGCRITGRLAVRDALANSAPSEVHVAAVTGYVIAASGRALAVYNTTGPPSQPARLVLAQEFARVDGGGDLGKGLAVWPQSDAPRTTDFLVVLGSGGPAPDLALYLSLLPYEESVPAMNWFRGPLMFGIGAMVFMWQFSKSRGRRGQDSMPPFPGFEGMGMDMPGMPGGMPGMPHGMASMGRRGGRGRGSGGGGGGGGGGDSGGTFRSRGGAGFGSGDGNLRPTSSFGSMDPQLAKFLEQARSATDGSSARPGLKHTGNVARAATVRRIPKRGASARSKLATFDDLDNQ